MPSPPHRSPRAAALIGAALAALALAGCAGAPATPAVAARPDAERVLAIQGALSYRARVPLPPTAYAVVAVRALDGGPALAERRIDLEGRQVPIPFALAIERAQLRDGTTYQLEGVVRVDGSVAWTVPPMSVDVRAPAIDTGIVWMTATRSAIAVATTWHCGGQDVTLDEGEAFTQLIVRTQRFRMRPVTAGAGTRYEAMSDPSTTLALEDGKARLTVRGNAYPDCTSSTPAVPLR